MILRLFLRFSRIDGASYREVTQRLLIRTGIRLLRTFQTLYMEGSAVLFGENLVYICLQHQGEENNMTAEWGNQKLYLEMKAPVLNFCYAQSEGLCPPRVCQTRSSS